MKSKLRKYTVPETPKEKNVFEKCKHLKEGDYIRIRGYNKICWFLITGTITYFDYGSKQLAVNHYVINFEDVVSLTKLDDRKR